LLAVGEKENVAVGERNSVSAERLANNLANKLYQKGGKKQLLAERCKLEAGKKSKNNASRFKIGVFFGKKRAFSL
jgi:hypothetical protein